MPIKAGDQVVGRVLSSLAIQLIGIGILIPSIFFIYKIGIIDILLIIVIGLIGSIPMTQIGMVIDISRPMLTWDNPQRAMKQNLNVLIAMGVGVLVLVGLFFLVKSLIFTIDIWYIYIILVIILVAISIVLYRLLTRLIEKQFIELE